MSKLRIVIPSHKRHDRVFAKYLVNDPIICVAKSQADLYKEFNPDCEIVTHPDDIIGLIPKRNWMAKHFRELFMLDDDVDACKRQLVNVVNPVGNTVREFCEEVAKYRPLNLHYTDELRPLDNFEQSVNETIFTVPLPYRNIETGISQVFSETSQPR